MGRCVECGKACNGKVHIACVLFRMGDIDAIEYRRILRKELDEQKKKAIRKQEHWWLKRTRLIHASPSDRIKFHFRRWRQHHSFRFAFWTVAFILRRKLLRYKNRGLTEEGLLKFMKPEHDGCCLEVGANTGFWTCNLSGKMEIHAFEPNPFTYAKLKENTKDLENVFTYQVALGEANYTTRLKAHLKATHDSLIVKEHDFTGVTITVQVQPLDSMNIRNVGLVIIDTEGYEMQVLIGARETLRKDKPRLVIELHKPYKQQYKGVTALLRSFGYGWFLVQEAGTLFLICDWRS